MGIAKLAISDGTTEISLLDLTGIHLSNDNGWTPKVIQAKSGGVFQDSSMAAGRRLVYRQFGTAREDFTFNIMGISQDDLIAETSNLLQLLEKAVNYWATDWQSEIVYLIARSDCETYARYAPILYYEAPELQNPYGQPFIQSGEGAIFDDIGIMIERSHWQDVAPGNSNCVQISNDENFVYTPFEDVGNLAAAASICRSLEAANGYLYIGDSSNINRSTDGGDTWALNTAAPTTITIDIFQLANGYIIATYQANGGMIISTDNGASWVAPTTPPATVPFQMIQLANGNVICCSPVGPNTIFYQSTDNGDNWAILSTYDTVDADTIYLLPSGNIIAAGNTGIIRSTDDGATWSRVFTIVGDVRIPLDIIENDGIILVGAGSNVVVDQFIYRSTDDGVTWELSATLDTGAITVNFGSFDIDANGAFYSCAYYLWKSTDGISWQIILEPSVALSNLLITSSGAIVLTDSPDILKNDMLTYTIGKSETCNDEVFIANKYNLANITNLKIYDASGASYTDIIPIVSPQDLFPASVDIGDILYVGIDDASVYPGTFCNVVFNIGTPMITTTSYTIIIEYYNGGWVTLSAIDNTSSFSTTGVNNVSFSVPSDIVSVAIDTITAKWIRFRISAESGTTTPPTQITDDIYSITVPYIQVADDIVLGDISATSRINATNKSDLDGPSGSAPNLWDNRVITGLRSLDRGSQFTSYINISDQQLYTGILVSVGTNTTFGTDVQAPTTRAATYNPGGVEAMATRATVTLSTSIARDFYGSYHAFLRVQRTTGASTDFNVQLVFVTGSGGIQKTTESKQVQTTTKFELLDFGQVTIPVGGSLASTDLGDQIQILIQASAASGTPNLVLYDLILIPVDEWAIDSVDQTNSSTSDIGRSSDIQKYLDIDSVTDPKNPIKSIVRQVSSDFVTANYNPITNGPAILQSNADQRLWFLAAQTSSTGSSYSWISPPEICHSVQLFKAQRYLGLRGAR